MPYQAQLIEVPCVGIQQLEVPLKLMIDDPNDENVIVNMHVVVVE